MSASKKAAKRAAETVKTPPVDERRARAPELEELPFPALGGPLLRELLARQQRELNEIVSEIAAAAGVRLEDGWQVDVQGGRFVRPMAAGE